LPTANQAKDKVSIISLAYLDAKIQLNSSITVSSLPSLDKQRNKHIQVSQKHFTLLIPLPLPMKLLQ